VYIELHAASAFSFLQGASLPETLIERAAALDYPAMALLDADGVYGAPRFHKAAKQAGLRAIIGAELTISGSGTRDPGSGIRDSKSRARDSRFRARDWTKNWRTRNARTVNLELPDPGSRFPDPEFQVHCEAWILASACRQIMQERD
jgi:PHP domain